MCICIFKPKDIILTKAVLHKCFDNNPDGAGFSYPDDKGTSMIVKRGFFYFREFWTAYRDIQKGRPMLVHFRIATSGDVDEANCHPWLIDKQHALIHNGNLEDKLDDKIEKMSDTGVFVSTILQPIFASPKLKGKRFWASAPFKWMMEESIGNSKIVILDASGFEMIYNVGGGEWEHGAWFSNKTYKEDRKSIRGVVVTTEHCTNGLVKEIKTFASGRTVTRYLEKIKEDKSKSFVLQPTPTIDALDGHSIIDIAEMY